MYLKKSQGAQNCEVHNVLLNLPWGAETSMHKKTIFFQPWNGMFTASCYPVLFILQLSQHSLLTPLCIEGILLMLPCMFALLVSCLKLSIIFSPDCSSCDSSCFSFFLILLTPQLIELESLSAKISWITPPVIRNFLWLFAKIFNDN